MIYPAHPRRCGENTLSSTDQVMHIGSSPQVRGKPQRHRSNLILKRLIPAGAGKTSANSATPTLNTAHPRRCGENVQNTATQVQMLGSSPQVRGKPGALSSRVVHIRLIPAGAGKTRCASPTHDLPPAHPRRCGENPKRLQFPSRARGSSPQVRGKRVTGHLCVTVHRLIPAGAGKT